MKLIMQIFDDKENIASRVRAIVPYADMSITGSNLDYVLEIEDVTQKQRELLYAEFDEENYGDGEYTLAGTLVAMLQDAGLKLATAESCTGGMVASEIVGIPGASDVLHEGLVTYSNEAKMSRLGVSYDTLRTFGAVSEETAVEMATGLIGANVSIGISTTGIAGPGGGTPDKPVGLVCMAVVSGVETNVFRHIFTGSRNEVRRKATNAIIFHAIQHIKNNF